VGSSPVEPRSIAAALAALLFLTYGYFFAAPSWNENSRFALTRSMVERGRLDIDPYQHDTGDKSFRDGHHYSDKAPGSSLLAVPAYGAYYGLLRATGGRPPSSIAAAGPADPNERILVNASFRRGLYLCNLFTNALAGALLGGLFFLTLCRRFQVAPRTALLATVALATGTLVLPYATMFYGHVLVAAFLFGAFHLIDDSASARRLVGAGALGGLAILTELTVAPAVLLLVAQAVWLVRPRRRVAWMALGAAGPLLALAAYQLAAFGSPWRSGYALVSRPDFAEGMSQGLMGIGWPRPGVLGAILVGRARGLLYTAPVLLLAFVGLGRKIAADLRQRRPEGPVAGAIVLWFLLMTAGYYMWYGGSAFGPRHVIPALPFLCLGLPFAFRRPRPVIFGVLLGLSVVNQLAATAVEPSAPMVTDVLFDYLYPHLLRGEVPLVPGASNLGALFRLKGPASLLPLVILWALALRTLIPLTPRERVP
jgi:hypothetical protein